MQQEREDILKETISTNPLPRMRTIRQAAQELNIPEFALRNWVKSGEVPAIYAGKKALVNLDRVICFLNGGEQA